MKSRYHLKLDELVNKIIEIDAVIKRTDSLQHSVCTNEDTDIGKEKIWKNIQLWEQR